MDSFPTVCGRGGIREGHNRRRIGGVDNRFGNNFSSLVLGMKSEWRLLIGINE